MWNPLRKSSVQAPPTFPTVQWADVAAGKLRNTPDYHSIIDQKIHPLFVYDDPGTVKTGIDSSMHVCTAFTLRPFQHWQKMLGEESFPVAFEADDFFDIPKTAYDAPQVKIKGSLYLVRTQLIIALDRAMENMVSYERKKTRLVIPFTEEVADRLNLGEVSHEKPGFRFLEAFMYVGKPDYWNNFLDCGYLFRPVPIYPTIERPGMGPHSYFTIDVF